MNRTSKINDDFKQNDIVQKYGEFTDVNTSQQRFCHQSELSNFSIVSLGSPMEIIDINHLLNDTLLVFQISNRQCYDCILSTINQLKLFCQVGSNLCSNFIIIAELFSIAELTMFKKINHIKQPIYLRVGDNSNHRYESIIAPHLLVVLPNSIVISKFIPEMSNPKRTYAFFENISSIYLN